MPARSIPDASFNDLLVLRAVMDLSPSPYGGRNQPQPYGWAIWNYIKENCRRVDAPSFATVYQTLKKLTERGVVAEAGLVRSNRGPHRVTYALTEAGQTYWYEVFAMTEWLSGG